VPDIACQCLTDFSGLQVGDTFFDGLLQAPANRRRLFGNPVTQGRGLCPMWRPGWPTGSRYQRHRPEQTLLYRIVDEYYLELTVPRNALTEITGLGVDSPWMSLRHSWGGVVWESVGMFVPRIHPVSHTDPPPAHNVPPAVRLRRLSSPGRRFQPSFHVPSESLIFNFGHILAGKAHRVFRKFGMADCTNGVRKYKENNRNTPVYQG
jgi:hypothetical protein